MKKVLLPPLKPSARPKRRMPPPQASPKVTLSPLKPGVPPRHSRARVSTEEDLFGLVWTGLATIVTLEARRLSVDQPRTALVVAEVARLVLEHGPEAAQNVVGLLCGARSRGGLDRAALFASDLTASEAGSLADALQDLEAQDIARARAALDMVSGLLGQALRFIPVTPSS